MKRRTFLGLAASAGGVGVLGATAAITNKPPTPPATHAEEPVLSTGQQDDPIMATDTTTAGREMSGTVQQSASVLDLELTNRYALVTKYRLIPGANETGTEWKTASLTVEHGWNSGTLVSHSGDIVPADDGNADSNLYLGTDRSTRRYRWNLTFDTATGNSHVFRFATVVDREEPPETDDTLVDTMFGAGFTKGFLRGSERYRATVRLVMQGTND